MTTQGTIQKRLVSSSLDARRDGNTPLAIPMRVIDGVEVFECPAYYAFGARYPDGVCHDGHICDADQDYCTEEFTGYIPCPACNNVEYQKYLERGGNIVYPYGYNIAHPDDYFMPRIGVEAWNKTRGRDE